MNSLAVKGAVDAAGAETDLTIRDGIIVDGQTSDAVFDASGLVALPGFIDTQTNGGIGCDFTHDPESIWKVGEWLPSTGVTSFCPTIITAPAGAIGRAQAAIASRPEHYVGAEPLGLHIEGPHLSAAKHGTHPIDLLTPPDEWSSPTDHIAIVTIAPELDRAIDLIRKLAAQGVIVSIGHSAASAETATAALDAGATLGTHLFNAMPPITGREPGIAGVLLTDPRASFGVIVDDVHLAPASIRLAWEAGGERFILVTDAIAAAGMPDGVFDLGGIEATLKDGAVRNREGNLAGSSLTMDQGLRNIIDVTGASLASASRGASTRAANVLGRRDLGRLAHGAAADIVLLDALGVVATLVGGNVAFNDEPDRMRSRSQIADTRDQIF